MPSRNEPCPCGSGQKYKRCCLVQLDVVARELRERDAFLGDLTAWLRAEHAQTLEDAGSHTTLIRMLGGVSGRGMSMVWA
ncbi:MAG TPA: SEC-C metal-binding domain-containing protein, partial [Coriobacteriia bacterium]|nr:SEC-C metal-binding domain-containing protein [Coriobacteriia bacterium]